MAILRKLWFGNFSLLASFWGFYVLGNIVVQILAMIIVGVIVLVASALPVWLDVSSPQFKIPAHILAYCIAAIIPTVYFIASSVGVWRSADNYPLSRWYPNFAKLVILFFAAIFLYRFIVGQGLQKMIGVLDGSVRF